MGESLEKDLDLADDTFDGDSFEGTTERKNSDELEDSPIATPRVYGALKEKKRKKK